MCEKFHLCSHWRFYCIPCRDGTVPLISLGYMCVKGWKDSLYNPAGIKVITREYYHETASSFDLRGGSKTADHVDILGNYAVTVSNLLHPILHVKQRTPTSRRLLVMILSLVNYCILIITSTLDIPFVMLYMLIGRRAQSCIWRRG